MALKPISFKIGNYLKKTETEKDKLHFAFGVHNDGKTVEYTNAAPNN